MSGKIKALNLAVLYRVDTRCPSYSLKLRDSEFSVAELSQTTIFYIFWEEASLKYSFSNEFVSEF